MFTQVIGPLLCLSFCLSRCEHVIYSFVVIAYMIEEKLFFIRSLHITSTIEVLVCGDIESVLRQTIGK